MKRLVTIVALALAGLVIHPSPAAADLTGFFGVSPDPSSRSAKGVAIGISLLVVGFEFEYSKLAEDEAQLAPGLTTGMGNILVMTPSFGVQLYATTGLGVYQEKWRDLSTTSFGSNLGGGVKFALAGPLRARIDYRVFALNGSPIYKRYQRIYGGVSLSF